jgi:hypothetical protein
MAKELAAFMEEDSITEDAGPHSLKDLSSLYG